MHPPLGSRRSGHWKKPPAKAARTQETSNDGQIKPAFSEFTCLKLVERAFDIQSLSHLALLPPRGFRSADDSSYCLLGMDIDPTEFFDLESRNANSRS